MIHLFNAIYRAFCMCTFAQDKKIHISSFPLIKKNHHFFSCFIKRALCILDMVHSERVWKVSIFLCVCKVLSSFNWLMTTSLDKWSSKGDLQLPYFAKSSLVVSHPSNNLAICQSTFCQQQRRLPLPKGKTRSWSSKLSQISKRVFTT